MIAAAPHLWGGVPMSGRRARNGRAGWHERVARTQAMAARATAFGWRKAKKMEPQMHAAQPLAATEQRPVPRPKAPRNQGAERCSAAAMMQMFVAAVAKQSSGHGVSRCSHGVSRRSDTVPGAPVMRQAETRRAGSFAFRATPCELRETPCPLDCLAAARTSASRPGPREPPAHPRSASLPLAGATAGGSPIAGYRHLVRKSSRAAANLRVSSADARRCTVRPKRLWAM